MPPAPMRALDRKLQGATPADWMTAGRRLARWGHYVEEEAETRCQEIGSVRSTLVNVEKGGILLTVTCRLTAKRRNARRRCN